MLFLLTALVFLVMLRLHRHQHLSRAIVEGFALFAALTYGFTEIMSSFQLLTETAWLVGWASLTGLIVAVATCRFISDPHAHHLFATLGKAVIAIKSHLLTFGLVAVILLGSLLAGLATPPNNYDARTYHLARIERWIAQGSLKPFPTLILRQLYMPPLAEVMSLQFRLLTHTDRVVFMPQWLGLVASLAALWYLTGLTGKRTIQILGLVLGATIPMALLQAGSTQNDLLLTSLVLAAVIHAHLTLKQPNFSHFAWLGLVVGLACLTKGTAYFLLLPLASWLVVTQLLKWRQSSPSIQTIASFLGGATLTGLIILALNVPTYLRNYQLMQQPIGSPIQEPIIFVELSPATFVANSLKSAAMQLQSSLEPVNTLVVSVTTQIIEQGLHVSINSPAITYNFFDPVGSRYYLSTDSLSEDSSGNAMHAGLFAIATIVGWWRFSKTTQWRFWWWLPVITFVLTFGLVKWQPWITRLQLPINFLAIPAMALGLSQLKPALRGAVMGIVMLLASSVLLLAPQRNALAWNLQPAPTPNLPEVMQIIAQKNAIEPIQELGVFAGHGNFPEYELLYQLNTTTTPTPVVQHVLVPNNSAAFATTHQLPTLIVCFECYEAEVATLSQTHELLSSAHPHLSLWTKKSQPEF